MRTIGIVTVARSDYGLYRPILHLLEADDQLDFFLLVSGSHLSEEHGSTVREIEADGFTIDERVELPLDDTPGGMAESIADGIRGFGAVYARRRPDVLLVLGDRFEMLAAVIAAMPFGVPVAHIHGGEVTEGAFDDAIRHAITKLSHLHFAATEDYARRIVQLGEEPWRVTVSGAPGLDNIRALSADQAPAPGIDEPFLLVTWHPVTLAEERLEELLAALESVDAALVFTHPNADPGRRAIVDEIDGFARRHGRARVFASLGTAGYFSLMRRALAMVGNSSSGIIEAASFGLPVVNVGARQRGRVRAGNVIDVDCERTAIEQGIRKAVSETFRASLHGLENPYGDGTAAEKIVARLREVPLDRKLLVKRFQDAQ